MQRLDVKLLSVAQESGFCLHRKASGILVLFGQNVEDILEVLELCHIKLLLEIRDRFGLQIKEHLDRHRRLIDLVDITVQRDARSAEFLIVIRLLVFKRPAQPTGGVAPTDDLFIEGVPFVVADGCLHQRFGR